MTEQPNGSERQLDTLLMEVEKLLKRPDVSLSLGARGVNVSIALIAAQGLHAYVLGNKSQAAEDLATAADELGARLEFAKTARRTRD
jgi:hypothetical protein